MKLEVNHFDILVQFANLSEDVVGFGRDGVEAVDEGVYGAHQVISRFKSIGTPQYGRPPH